MLGFQIASEVSKGGNESSYILFGQRPFAQSWVLRLPLGTSFDELELKPLAFDADQKSRSQPGAEAALAVIWANSRVYEFEQLGNRADIFERQLDPVRTT